MKNVEPSFHHIEAKDLPAWAEGDLRYTLIAGKGFGKQSPVPVYSDLFLVEVKAKTEKEISISNQLEGEVAIYVLDGSVRAGNEEIERGNVFGVNANGWMWFFQFQKVHTL